MNEKLTPPNTTDTNKEQGTRIGAIMSSISLEHWVFMVFNNISLFGSETFSEVSM